MLCDHRKRQNRSSSLKYIIINWFAVTPCVSSLLRLSVALKRAGDSTFRAVCTLLVVRRLLDSNYHQGFCRAWRSGEAWRILPAKSCGRDRWSVEDLSRPAWLLKHDVSWEITGGRWAITLCSFMLRSCGPGLVRVMPLCLLVVLQMPIDCSVLKSWLSSYPGWM